MSTSPETLHATALKLGPKGLLIRGASGSGKSSLAMRLIDEALLFGGEAVLVADDRVILSNEAGTLVAKVPPNLQGLIEIRGVGILKTDHLDSVRISLVIDLVPEDHLDRLPSEGADKITLDNVTVPRLQIAERNPDAAAIVRTWLRSEHNSSVSISD